MKTLYFEVEMDKVIISDKDYHIVEILDVEKLDELIKSYVREKYKSEVKGRYEE